MAFFTYSAEDQNIRSELVLIFFGNFFQQNNRLIYRSGLIPVRNISMGFYSIIVHLFMARLSIDIA